MGFTVTMNRDEANMRGPELPPKRQRSPAGLEWIAPFDSDKGGTWMAANDHGIVAALLNAYLPGESLLPDTSQKHRTRGEIIPAVMDKRSLADAMDWLESEFDPSAYPSFNLFVFAPESALCLTWYARGDLSVEHIDDEWYIRSSSGWDTEEVTNWRTQRFRQWRENGCDTIGSLPTFHVLRVEGEEEKSPLMLRSWSATRSITQVELDRKKRRVKMRYWGNPEPGSNSPDNLLEMSLSEDVVLR